MGSPDQDRLVNWGTHMAFSGRVVNPSLIYFRFGSPGINGTVITNRRLKALEGMFYPSMVLEYATFEYSIHEVCKTRDFFFDVRL